MKAERYSLTKGSSDQVMNVLCWLKLPSFIPKIAPIEQLLLCISEQMRTISSQPKSIQS